jgi:hypothetical protein
MQLVRLDAVEDEDAVHDRPVLQVLGVRLLLPGSFLGR